MDSQMTLKLLSDLHKGFQLGQQPIFSLLTLWSTPTYYSSSAAMAEGLLGLTRTY
jgi:hypothetical protein